LESSTPQFFFPAIAALLLNATAIVAAPLAPPVAPVREVTDSYFGTTMVDPYRYMENLKDPEVAGWMKAQADYTRNVLDLIPQRAEVLKEIETYGDAAPARVSGVQINAGYTYYEKRKANENIGKVYVRRGFGGN